MSNWPISPGVRTETLGAGTGAGTSVTANAAADTKGSYSTIGTTAFAASGFMVSIGNTAASAHRFRIDIAVNTGGADTIIVFDFFWDTTSGGQTSFFVPVELPSGAAVKARCQAEVGSSAVAITVTTFAKDARGEPGHPRAVSCTDFTNTLPANSVTQTGTTFTAWTTIAAAIPARICSLILALNVAGDTTRTASNLLVEIGYGAAGSEVSIGKFVGRQSTGAITLNGLWYMPCDVPSGVRLAFRVQCSAAAADSITVAALGVAA